MRNRNQNKSLLSIILDFIKFLFERKSKQKEIDKENLDKTFIELNDGYVQINKKKKENQVDKTNIEDIKSKLNERFK